MNRERIWKSGFPLVVGTAAGLLAIAFTGDGLHFSWTLVILIVVGLVLIEAAARWLEKRMKK